MKLQQLIKPTSLSRGFALILSLIMLFGILGGNAPHAKAATNDFPCYGTVVNAPSGLILRKSASTTSDVLDVVPNGTDVKVVGIEGQWFRTEYGNNVGYLRSDYVELIGIVANANAYGGLMRRKGPGTNFDGLGRVPDGTRIRILRLDKSESGSPWYFGVCNGEECYVSAAYVQLNKKQVSSQDTNVPSYTEEDFVAKGTVVGTDSLNVRLDPSTKNPIQGSVTGGTVLVFDKKTSNSWYRISEGTYKGLYVSGNYIRLHEEKKDNQESSQNNNVPAYTEEDFVAKGTVVGTDSLNVRLDPSTKNPIQGSVAGGTVLAFDKKTSNSWYRISEGTYKGLYVSGNYIRLPPAVEDKKEEIPQNPSAEKCGRVTASALNMRIGPSTAFTAATALPKNTVVKLISKFMGADGYYWFEASYNSTIGYVRSDYIHLEGISLDDIPEKKFTGKYPMIETIPFWGIIDASVELFDESGNVTMSLPRYALVQILGQSAYNANHYIVSYWGTTGIIHTTKVSKVTNALHTDVPNQKTTLLRNGQPVVQTDCVTGLKNEMDTPVGKYSVLNYAEDVVLRGNNLDGSAYAQPVDFWVRFYGGYGYHDANYRDVFGGTIYKTNGSHGCINLPPKYAEQIYSQIYVGLPVYVSGY